MTSCFSALRPGYQDNGNDLSDSDVFDDVESSRSEGFMTRKGKWYKSSEFLIL